MLAGMIAGATFVVVLLLLVQLRKGQGEERRAIVVWSATGIAIAGAILATVLAFPGKGGVEQNGAGAPFGTAAISWADVERVSRSLDSSVTGAVPPMEVAPVPSLIGGLERRLESDPADVKGWALLAQSYAFVGDPVMAEQALLRAVELGFDEAELRQRVASAVRDPHADLPGFGSTRP